MIHYLGSLPSNSRRVRLAKRGQRSQCHLSRGRACPALLPQQRKIHSTPVLSALFCSVLLHSAPSLPACPPSTSTSQHQPDRNFRSKTQTQPSLPLPYLPRLTQPRLTGTPLLQPLLRCSLHLSISISPHQPTDFARIVASSPSSSSSAYDHLSPYYIRIDRLLDIRPNRRLNHSVLAWEALLLLLSTALVMTTST